jgi:CheY-like chemotaxis protein
VSRILLVEDNENNRDMLTKRLSRRGYEVVCAVSADDCFAKLCAGRPDLILMDVELLPGPDGWEATRRLKGDPETRSIPVLALTAHAMAEHRDRSLEAGCDDYDTKPIELPRLLAKIEALLQRMQNP